MNETPEQALKLNRYLAFQRGFKDGAAGRVHRSEVKERYDEYMVGYRLGKRACDEAVAAYARAHDVPSSGPTRGGTPNYQELVEAICNLLWPKEGTPIPPPLEALSRITQLLWTFAPTSLPLTPSQR